MEPECGNIPTFHINQRNICFEKNKIIKEESTKFFHHLIRSIVQTNCENRGQNTRTFGDKQQHDAGEFLMSIFQQIFEDLPMSNNFDEKIFGGLYQETLVCKKGHMKQTRYQGRRGSRVGKT